MFSLKSDIEYSNEGIRNLKNKTSEELGLTKEVVEDTVSTVLRDFYKILEEKKTSTFNRIFLMESIHGENKYIIRFNLPISDGYAVNSHLQQWAASEAIYEEVLTPKILITDTSHQFCDFDFQIMEYLEGLTLYEIRNDEESICNVLKQLGEQLKNLHKIHSEKFGLLGLNLFDIWEQYLDQNLDSHITYLERNGLIDDPFDLLMAYHSGLEKLPILNESHLLHGDLSYHNIITNNGNLAGIIDWEDALFGDPIFDLANLATFHPERRHEYFLNSYKNKPEDFNNRFWFYYLRISMAKAVHRHRFGYIDKPEDGYMPANERINLAISKLKKL